MINRLQLLRNIGQFDSVSSAADIDLARLTLVYAENGRGKTTIAAILRSLATGDPVPIAERRRLSVQHPPHVVLSCTGGPPDAMFENNAWNRSLPDMVVFDDVFVDENLYSGLAVESEHRQNLHELILGSQGVTLNQQVQAFVTQIETHNAALRTRAAAIPVAVRGTLSVDDFCALQDRPDIDEAIQTAERNLAASREQEPIRNTSGFDTLSLPGIDINIVDGVLQQDLQSLDTAAAARVQEHLENIGDNAEAWIENGMSRIPETGNCPFCAQDLSASPVISHYRAYFSEEYTALKQTVADALVDISHRHGGGIAAGFERAVRGAVERRQFWSRFCDVPDVAIDTAEIVRDWTSATNAIEAVLRSKQGAPLERSTLSEEVRNVVATYEAHRQAVAALNQQLQQTNVAIQIVKEQAAAGNPAALSADVASLKAIKARYTPETSTLCDDYLAEKAAKVQTEQQRDQAKAALDNYRSQIFPGYQTAINLYLERFNAGFRIDSVSSQNTRGGPSCTYNVVINNTPVAVAGGSPAPGEPSFRNTLNAGDRNTLALAFFFASLDQNPNLAGKVVVIDDPITSLDDHRSLTTVQEIRRLADSAAQIIVLSHTKPFLCRIWEGVAPSIREALQVTRDGQGSTIRQWDVDQDSITEHDRRHSMLRAYLDGGMPNEREVARSIRPLLEAFLRVAFPEYFPPGTLLGPFRHRCEQQAGTQQEILNTQDTQELRDLVEYANRFHHDTNPAWETEAINDGELMGYVDRALRFAKR